MLNILTVPLGIAVFAVVWLASHAINALILLSPWGAIDAVLKGVRTALLGLITVTAMLDPWISVALSAVVILIAYLVAGWAFRLTIFGAIFSWDFLTFRKHRFQVAEKGENLLFSSNTLTKQGVPMRIPIEFSIAETGKVSKVWVDNPDFRTGVLPECLLKELQKWPFRASPVGGATVQLSFNIGKPG